MEMSKTLKVILPILLAVLAFAVLQLFLAV